MSRGSRSPVRPGAKRPSARSRAEEDQMRALQYTEHGGPEVLSWGDAPTLHAERGQIRIAVRAASVNPLDWKLVSGVLSGGQAMSGPASLGFDAAGVVDEVGEGVI